MKELFISLAVFVVAGGSWGAIYYNEIVMPREQATELFRLWEEGKRFINIPGETNVTQDTATVIEKVARDEINMLSGLRVTLDNLFVRQEFVSLKQEFIAFLNAHNAIRQEIERDAAFLAHAELFLSEFEKVFLVLEQSSFPSNRKKDVSLPMIRTIGDLERFWSAQIPKAEDAGSLLVAGENTPLLSAEDNVAIAHEWVLAKPHLETLLSFVKKVASNPSVTPEVAVSRMSPAENARVQKSFESLEASRKLFQKILRPILTNGVMFGAGEESVEMSERAFRVYQGMRQINMYIK